MVSIAFDFKVALEIRFGLVRQFCLAYQWDEIVSPLVRQFP